MVLAASFFGTGSIFNFVFEAGEVNVVGDLLAVVLLDILHGQLAFQFFAVEKRGKSDFHSGEISLEVERFGSSRPILDWNQGRNSSMRKVHFHRSCEWVAAVAVITLDVPGHVLGLENMSRAK